jgi:ketosteroid isomerase-like protein
MSQENVEVVRKLADAYEAGDYDRLVDLLAPDVEAVPDASVFPEAGPLHGRDEYRRWLEEIGTAWVSVHWDTKEVRATGTDQVLLRSDWGGVGAASGVETYSSLTGVFTFRDERVCRIEWYFDHNKALKAVGLEQ